MKDSSSSNLQNIPTSKTSPNQQQQIFNNIRQNQSSPPSTALPTLLAANYIPPPKSPLCMSASSPFVETIVSLPNSSSSSSYLISQQQQQNNASISIHSNNINNSSSIISRRRVPKPLPLISVREMPITTTTTNKSSFIHSPLKSLFSSSSYCSSPSPSSISGSTSQLFVLKNSVNSSVNSSICALSSPFLEVGEFFKIIFLVILRVYFPFIYLFWTFCHIFN